ncbi:TRAP transporter small permease subunit [Neptunomonas phycophila]|uniref:TRAP transporter small permease subunit n=1 Tax=Neptunomonas phycophila TaxID=1572645 RepID=UPI001BE8B8A6|nr:TRAP transporter small permease subunit [Neptunomonas phycophila]MBT3146505.1 TRAP transporter small permease subunit [Neptunomonas phycophila]MDO6785045.1 TRAP transporter small permease subunit [Neptunomonas phycophila]
MHNNNEIKITQGLTELDSLNQDIELPVTKFSTWLDNTLIYIGKSVSLIWIFLIAVIIFNVFMRYILGEGRIEFEELQWHLYSIGWLFGLSYCLVTDNHVRVDLVHHRLTLRTKAWLELLGLLFFLIPFICIVLWYAVPFIAYSWTTGEISGAPGGLPYRWLIKAVLFLGFILLAFATLSRLSRVCAYLFPLKAHASHVQAIA